MKKIMYYWKNWENCEPIVKHIEMAFPCWVVVSQAFGYVRIECRKEDYNRIKELLENENKMS